MPTARARRVRRSLRGDEVSTARRLFVKYRRLSAEYARTAGAAVRPEGERYENLGR